MSRVVFVSKHVDISEVKIWITPLSGVNHGCIYCVSVQVRFCCQWLFYEHMKELLVFEANFTYANCRLDLEDLYISHYLAFGKSSNMLLWYQDFSFKIILPFFSYSFQSIGTWFKNHSAELICTEIHSIFSSPCSCDQKISGYKYISFYILLQKMLKVEMRVLALLINHSKRCQGNELDPLAKWCKSSRQGKLSHCHHWDCLGRLQSVLIGGRGFPACNSLGGVKVEHWAEY